MCTLVLSTIVHLPILLAHSILLCRSRDGWQFFFLRRRSSFDRNGSFFHSDARMRLSWRYRIPVECDDHDLSRSSLLQLAMRGEGRAVRVAAVGRGRVPGTETVPVPVPVWTVSGDAHSERAERSFRVTHFLVGSTVPGTTCEEFLSFSFHPFCHQIACTTVIITIFFTMFFTMFFLCFLLLVVVFARLISCSFAILVVIGLKIADNNETIIMKQIAEASQPCCCCCCCCFSHSSTCQESWLPARVDFPPFSSRLWLLAALLPMTCW